MDARFELGSMRDGGLVLMSNASFDGEIKRVEYYRDQRLFMLVYADETRDGDLMDYEVSDFAAGVIKKSANNILVVNAENPANLVGFDVPLIQVGV